MPIHDQEDFLPKSQLLVVLSGLSLSLLVCFIDQNSTSILLPTLGVALDASDTISWAGTSALIANAVFLVFYGRMSDIFGRKIVYLIVIALLAIGNLLCGFARNGAELYVFRGIAGVGAGGIASMSMMVLSDVVSLQDRGKYQGLLGANVGFGSVIGPFMAAGFIESATWRAHFWTVSPLAAVCGVVIIFLLPKGKVSAGAKEKLKLIDYWGVFFSTAATMLLLIPLSGGGSYFAWGSSMVISMMVLGGICLVIFMIIEWKFATLPMMPLHLFRNRAVASMLVANILFGAVYFSEVYFIPLYCQLVRGNTAIESAALTIPLSVGLSSASIVSGYIISHRGQYIDVLWFGFSLWTIALGLQILFDPKTNAAVIVVVLLIQGWGVGCIFQPTLVALQAHCSKADRAVVIAVRNYLRQFGGAAGLAMFSAIFANVLQNKLESSKDLPTSLAKSIGSNVFRTPDLSLLSPAEKKAVINAYAQGMRICFIIFVPILGICLLSCLFIKDTGLQRAEEKVEAASDTVPVAPLPQDIEKGTRSSPEKDENIDNGEKPKVSEMHKLGSNRISSEETLASRPQPSI